MKYEDCNERQKKAFRNILGAANWIIGGLENTLADNYEDSEEYRRAKGTLEDHDYLVNLIYREATTSLYCDGSVFFDKSAESYLKDVRFCGKKWLMERCEARVKKMGY